jgi:hypothetical protein
MACDPFLIIATIPVHPYGWTASRGSGGLARSQQLSRSANGGALQVVLTSLKMVALVAIIIFGCAQEGRRKLVAHPLSRIGLIHF